MGTICQQCGGKGFDNAFVYCVTCLNFAVHRYCLPELPKTFDEFVRWYCEDCEPKSAKHSLPRKPCSSPSSERDHLISKGVRVKKSSNKLKKKDVSCLVLQTEDQGQQCSPSQEPCEVKTKLDCTVDARQSSPYQEDSDAQTKLRLTEHAQLASDSSYRNLKLKGAENNLEPLVAETEEETCQSSPWQQTCEAQTELALCVASFSSLNENTTMQHLVAETEEQICQTIPSQQPCEAQTQLALCGSSFSPLKENMTMQHSVPETEEETLQSSAAQLPCEMQHPVPETEEETLQSSPAQLPCEAKTELALCMVSTSPFNTIQPCSENSGNDLKLVKRRKLTVEGGSEFSEEAELDRINDAQTATDDLSDTLGQNYHLHAQPASDRIWRGSFSIYKRIFGIFDGVVAHLSSKACPKVCEKAALLPAVLRLEMLPKSALWPDSFQKSEPCDDHIALYFFPESKWYEWVFDCLVEDMIDQELAMRAIIKDAELLVFPSAELPIQYWKFQGKYYLWGVFQKKQDSSFYLADKGLLVENSNTELVVYSNSVNSVSTVTKTWDARSPQSPLSNNCSLGSGP